MATIGLSAKRLNKLLGSAFQVEELSEHLADLGCDVEESCDVDLFLCPACGNGIERMEEESPPRSCGFCGYTQEKDFETIGTDRVIKLSLLAARPDLMDIGGLTRALKGMLSLEAGLPEFAVSNGTVEVHVDPELKKPESFRPYIDCAVVTLPPIDSELLRDIMKLQENLHWAIGRDRKLSSIGVYDMDAITPPIAYRAVGPEELTFVPLGMPERRMTPREILEQHPKGVGYAHLLKNHLKYPLLSDSKGQVLSLPPIINSEETKVKIGSSRFFVDVTGLSPSNVSNALHTLVSSLAELGATIESTRIVDSGTRRTTPNLAPTRMSLAPERARKWLGIPVSDDEIVQHLQRMRFSAIQAEGNIEVSCPCYRVDIKHQVDLFEDIVISYGFRSVPLTLDSSFTTGQERPEERMSALARQALIGFGFTEIMSLMQTTEANHFTRFRMTPGQEYVKISNPKSAEYNVLRSNLMTGLMECLEKNRRKSPPVRIFEIGNVFLVEDAGKDGTRIDRRLAFASMGPGSGFAEGRSVMDGLLAERWMEAGYRPETHPAFVEGRVGGIFIRGERMGILGEIHPEVLENFSIPHPVVFGELRICTLSIPDVF